MLSPAAYNVKSGLALVCPVTRQAKGYPFETPIPNGLAIQGVVLSDHLRSLDWRTRRAEFICRLSNELLEDVAAKAAALVSGRD